MTTEQFIRNINLNILSDIKLEDSYNIIYEQLNNLLSDIKIYKSNRDGYEDKLYGMYENADKISFVYCGKYLDLKMDTQFTEDIFNKLGDYVNIPTEERCDILKWFILYKYKLGNIKSSMIVQFIEHYGGFKESLKIYK